MSKVFADTFYFLAIVNPRDRAHQCAIEMGNLFEGEIVSTAWVFTELGDALCKAGDRAVFLRTFELFDTDARGRLIEPDTELFRAGVELFRARPDKEWSLTDCISFVVMEREGITDALTGDRHFTQAGFNAVLA